MQNEYEAWEATGKGGEMSAGSQSHWGINGESRANRIDGEYINLIENCCQEDGEIILKTPSSGL